MRHITLAIALLGAFGCTSNTASSDPAAGSADEHAASSRDHDRDDDLPRQVRLSEGRHIFRFDTFGDEDFWGGTLRLHQAIEGSAHGGVGPGVSPKTALAVGLKVDVDALSKATVAALKAGKVNLDDPAVTVALLTSNAVVGVTGFSDGKGGLRTLGIQCALCHSTVDNSFAPGIGHRLDGWPNRDLNVGAIVGLSPDLSAVAKLLGVDEKTVRAVLASWGPGKFDAELFLDGKAFRPDGKSAATLIPAAFGLAGVNLHTYTGWGSIPYWNAFVAVLEMHGKGSFYDPRLDDASKFPVAARAGFGDVKADPDLVSSKLAALHEYQLSLEAPRPSERSFNEQAARRGQQVFAAKCAQCHVAPLYTESGWNMHTGAEIGIDDFQASRSPDGRYRTTPLRGLFTRAKGGFYHDGRFATLPDVVEHYNSALKLGLAQGQKTDLVEFLKSL
jgi:cytochrome c5